MDNNSGNNSGNKTILYVVIGLGVLFVGGFACVFGLAFFGGFASYTFMRQSGTVLEDQTRARLSQVDSAIKVYQVSNSKPPASLDDLVSGDSPALSSPSDLNDAWGQRFEYKPGDGDYTLYSRGADGAAGTDDDISK